MIEQNPRKRSGRAARATLVARACEFPRPDAGASWIGDPSLNLPFTGAVAWQSNGGPSRKHPGRSLPYAVEGQLPDGAGELRVISLVGVFAMYADDSLEAPGAVGATFQLLNGPNIVFRQELLNGRHYRDSRKPSADPLNPGDGTSLRHLGMAEIDGERVAVSRLTIDLPSGISADGFRFKDLGSASSFVCFDIFAEFEPTVGCPFRATSGGIALTDLPAIIRISDRVRFTKAVDQLVAGIEKAEDLDEAKGQALTFLAIVAVGALERGGVRTMHKHQLAVARELEKLTNLAAIGAVIQSEIWQIAEPLFAIKSGPSSHLIDRALMIVERNFARPLDDASVAAQLGLSTSHFRFLFKEATAQPFHKYLIAMRLEKAKRMLAEQDVSVSAVATAVGFCGLAHFSRAFSQRFGISPSHVRRN